MGCLCSKPNQAQENSLTAPLDGEISRDSSLDSKSETDDSILPDFGHSKFSKRKKTPKQLIRNSFKEKLNKVKSDDENRNKSKQKEISQAKIRTNHDTLGENVVVDQLRLKYKTALNEHNLALTQLEKAKLNLDETKQKLKHQQTASFSFSLSFNIQNYEQAVTNAEKEYSRAQSFEESTRNDLEEAKKYIEGFEKPGCLIS